MYLITETRPDHNGRRHAILFLEGSMFHRMLLAERRAKRSAAAERGWETRRSAAQKPGDKHA